MAAVDPIVYAPLCKFFYDLTHLQAADLCLYSVGASYNQIASCRGVSAITVRKSLESAQKKYQAESLTLFRGTFWGRVLVNLIFSPQNYSVKKNEPELSFDNERFIFVRNLFPEMNTLEVKKLILLISGRSTSEIAVFMSSTESRVLKSLENICDRLGIEDLPLLKMVGLSRIVANLS